MSRVPLPVTLVVLGASTPGSGPEVVAEILGVGPSTVVHACPRCGSSAHGPLRVSAVPGAPARWASVSRSPERTLVALSDAGPVGVDLEADGAGGLSADALQRWCVVEAAVKATGWGLAVDPDHLQLVQGGWLSDALVAVPPPLPTARAARAARAAPAALRPRNPREGAASGDRGTITVRVQAVDVPDHRAAVALAGAHSAGNSLR